MLAPAPERNGPPVLGRTVSWKRPICRSGICQGVSALHMSWLTRRTTRTRSQVAEDSLLPEGRPRCRVRSRGLNVRLQKSWQVASQTLRADERVIAATKAQRVRGKNEDWGVLTISDQRLLFVHARAFATTTEEIPFTNITGVVRRTDWGLGCIEVAAAGGITTTFHQISSRRVAPVMEAIQSDLARLSAPSKPATSPPSPADEIKKLAQLRDSGMLTEEEFSAKKRQILGL